MQSITEYYYRVLQSITKTNLAHLLRPIFGLVFHILADRTERTGCDYIAQLGGWKGGAACGKGKKRPLTAAAHRCAPQSAHTASAGGGLLTKKGRSVIEVAGGPPILPTLSTYSHC